LKKKTITIIMGLILLIIIFPFISDWYTEMTAPNRVLRVGEQTSEDRIDFVNDIEDENKITEYENLYDELEFSNEEQVPEGYPDFIIQVWHKQGYITGVINVWSENEEGIVIKPSAGLYAEPENSNKKVAKLTGQQLEKLKEIIE